MSFQVYLKLVPVLKEGSEYYDMANYNSVTLTLGLSKIFERTSLARFTNSLRKQIVLAPVIRRRRHSLHLYNEIVGQIEQVSVLLRFFVISEGHLIFVSVAMLVIG